MTLQPRVKRKYTRGPCYTSACDRCAKNIQLMCKDRCEAGRAVLCEIVTEEERELDYEVQSV